MKSFGRSEARKSRLTSASCLRWRWYQIFRDSTSWSEKFLIPQVSQDTRGSQHQMANASQSSACGCASPNGRRCWFLSISCNRCNRLNNLTLNGRNFQDFHLSPIVVKVVLFCYSKWCFNFLPVATPRSFSWDCMLPTPWQPSPHGDLRTMRRRILVGRPHSAKRVQSKNQSLRPSAPCFPPKEPPWPSI